MKNIAKKLLAVQGEVSTVKKSEDNPFFNSKYFDINGLLAVLKPVLTKHGLVIMQNTITDGERNNILNTVVIDPESGESISSNIYLPQDNNPQKAGSGITYYRRYALQAMFALQAEDDDANSVSAAPNSSKPKPKAQASSGYTNPLAP